MIVTVCQLRVEGAAGPVTDWPALVAHVHDHESDLILLPEMPFYPWPFAEEKFRPAVWANAEKAHESWLLRLGEFGTAIVAASRPVTRGGRRLNEGFIWSVGQGYTAIHDKVYLPDEAGFWEASWYERGEKSFRTAPLPGETAAAGFLICTELWFLEQARAYGQAGAGLLLTPRATEKRTVDRWLAAGRVAAIVAGAYSLSSNHSTEADEPVPLGGQGWVITPEGEVLVTTSATQPFVSVEIDLSVAEAARTTYPRYVVG